jgi:hypothetical protein
LGAPGRVVIGRAGKAQTAAVALAMITWPPIAQAQTLPDLANYQI